MIPISGGKPHSNALTPKISFNKLKYELLGTVHIVPTHIKLANTSVTNR